MATRPPRICGCGCGKVLKDGERCPVATARRKAAARAFEANRPSARERGYSTRWQKASRAFLAQPGNGTCVHCGAPAELVDHRIAHKGNMALFWDLKNWQPSCKRCNSRKAVREEGGFGRPLKRGAL